MEKKVGTSIRGMELEEWTDMEAEVIWVGATICGIRSSTAY